MLPDILDMTCVTEQMVRDLYEGAGENWRAPGRQCDFDYAYKLEVLRKQDPSNKVQMKDPYFDPNDTNPSGNTDS